MNTAVSKVFGEMQRCQAPVIGALLALLTLGGCEREPGAEQQPPAPAEVLVSVVKVQDAPVSREWVSTLDGSSNAQVKARVQGYLLKQNYTDGALVKTGELLFKIDPRSFVAALAQANADLAKAIAKQVETGLNEKRQLQLFATRSISEAERDQAVQLNAATKASVLAAQAVVDKAKLDLSYTRILAPIEGVAGIAKPGIGDLVGPLSGELTSISTVNPIKAVFQISELEYLKAIEKLTTSTSQKSGDSSELELVLADGAVFPHKGKVSVLNRQFDVRTGTIQVEALFPNPGNVLRPGFFARVRLVMLKKGVILIPQRAVMEVQDVRLVAVVTPQNRIEMRRIECGDRAGANWIVSKGLNAGERIVVEGTQKLHQGMLVSPQPFVSDQQPQNSTTDTLSSAAHTEAG